MNILGIEFLTLREETVHLQVGHSLLLTRETIGKEVCHVELTKG